MKINIKKSAWHYKYLKWSLKIEENNSIFKNLCPYFWTLVYAILFSPFILSTNLIKYLLFENKLVKNFNTFFTKIFKPSKHISYEEKLKKELKCLRISTITIYVISTIYILALILWIYFSVFIMKSYIILPFLFVGILIIIWYYLKNKNTLIYKVIISKKNKICPEIEIID